VRRHYPDTARLILSGQIAETDMIRVVALAHQFLGSRARRTSWPGRSNGRCASGPSWPAERSAAGSKASTSSPTRPAPSTSCWRWPRRRPWTMWPPPGSSNATRRW
jgi:hypothetical protein